MKAYDDTGAQALPDTGGSRHPFGGGGGGGKPAKFRSPILTIGYGGGGGECALKFLKLDSFHATSINTRINGFSERKIHFWPPTSRKFGRFCLEIL